MHHIETDRQTDTQREREREKKREKEGWMMSTIAEKKAESACASCGEKGPFAQ